MINEEPEIGVAIRDDDKGVSLFVDGVPYVAKTVGLMRAARMVYVQVDEKVFPQLRWKANASEIIGRPSGDIIFLFFDSKNEPPVGSKGQFWLEATPDMKELVEWIEKRGKHTAEVDRDFYR